MLCFMFLYVLIKKYLDNKKENADCNSKWMKSAVTPLRKVVHTCCFFLYFLYKDTKTRIS